MTLKLVVLWAALCFRCRHLCLRVLAHAYTLVFLVIMYLITCTLWSWQMGIYESLEVPAIFPKLKVLYSTVSVHACVCYIANFIYILCESQSLSEICLVEELVLSHRITNPVIYTGSVIAFNFYCTQYYLFSWHPNKLLLHWRCC